MAGELCVLLTHIMLMAKKHIGLMSIEISLREMAKRYLPDTPNKREQCSVEMKSIQNSIENSLLAMAAAPAIKYFCVVIYEVLAVKAAK